jgi:hypothetical protein
MIEPVMLASSEDRAAWLEARRKGVTATEVAKLANGRVSDRKTLRDQKISGEFVDLSGNKFIEWGIAREPVIAEWIERKFDIVSNTNAFANGMNERHIATPDGISATFETDRTIAEIKTSMKDLTPGTAEFDKTNYYDQIQWQMHVMNAGRTLFVFEQHDNVWNPMPTPFEPQHFWIERDDQRIEQLIEIADSFLEFVNEITETELPVDDELSVLADRLLELRVAEAEAKASKELVWKRIQEIVNDREDFSDQTPTAKISWNTSVKEIDVVDMDSFREKESVIVSQYETKLAEYTTKETQEKRTLTVNALKK